MRRYPWKRWGAYPFQPWTITRGRDFDCEPKQMLQTLSMWGYRHGFLCTGSYNDPTESGRLVFQFYEKHLKHFPPYVAFEIGSVQDITTVADPSNYVLCVICRHWQPRAPHLRHILECLVRDPKTTTGTALYAKHRSDNDDPTGMRKVDHVGSTWTPETGPVSPN